MKTILDHIHAVCASWDIPRQRDMLAFRLALLRQAAVSPVPVYCLMGSYDHEGSTILHMFFSKDKADEILNATAIHMERKPTNPFQPEDHPEQIVFRMREKTWQDVHPLGHLDAVFDKYYIQEHTVT